MSTINKLLNPSDLRLAADLKLTSNGDGAKTAKVTITARSGDPICHPYWGNIVHDFSGMTAKPRIPLDYAHDPDDSIGYLNRFDVSSGDLVCSGAIVLIDGAPDGDADDDVNALVAKIQAGIPYEASIEFDDDMTLEFVPEGMTVGVNGRDIAGPVTVVRQWTLKAVAICKFGADSDTSVELQFKRANVEEQKQGFFIRFAKTNQKVGEFKMSNEEKQPVAAVEPSVEAAPVAAVEADAKAQATELSAVKAEGEQPVEASVTEDQKQPEVVAEVVTQLSEQPKVEAVDPRSEFKQFVAEFGEKASDYFAAGLSYSEALKQFAADVKAENEDLKKKFAAINRGAAKPVTFAEQTEAPARAGLAGAIRFAKK